MGGVISFFTRSPQRMHELSQAASNEEGLGFVSMCRTRFAFVVFSALRLIRLRVSAKEALDKITVSASEADKLDDEELLYSTRGKVYETLSSDSFFEDLELYVRLAYPVMVIMREFDTAAPMAGFVYWAFANILKKIEKVFRSKKDSEEDQQEALRLQQKIDRFGPLKEEILESIDSIWEKRHSPVHSAAYLLNPIFHQALFEATDGNPLAIELPFFRLCGPGSEELAPEGKPCVCGFICRSGEGFAGTGQISSKAVAGWL